MASTVLEGLIIYSKHTNVHENVEQCLQLAHTCSWLHRKLYNHYEKEYRFWFQFVKSGWIDAFFDDCCWPIRVRPPGLHILNHMGRECIKEECGGRWTGIVYYLQGKLNQVLCKEPNLYYNFVERKFVIRGHLGERLDYAEELSCLWADKLKC